MLMQFAGIVIVLAPWFFMIFLPNHDLIAQYNSYYASQHGDTVVDFLRNMAIQPFFIYFNRMPLIFTVFWLAATHDSVCVHMVCHGVAVFHAHGIPTGALLSPADHSHGDPGGLAADQISGNRSSPG